jgi:hypothetical protein
MLKEVLSGTKNTETGKAKLEQTRHEITADWRRSLGVVLAQGQHGLALQIGRFIKSLPPLENDRDALKAQALMQVISKREALPPRPVNEQEWTLSRE